MELLQEDRLGDAKLYAQMAQSMAERFETQEEWFKARQYWKIVTKWHHLANDREAYRNTVINHAASIEQQAVSSALRGQHGLARSFLDDAIQLLRTIPQMDEKIDELIQKITEYQAPALSEFGRISVPVDLTAVIEKLNDQVMRGSGAESLMQLGLVCLDVDITVFREIVESSIDHSLAARLPLRRVGADGQTIDVIDGLNKENREKRILQKMYELAAMNQTTTAAIIEQGRLKIREGYTLTDEDINKLVENNIFIPKNRIRSIARGLRSGLEGDFLASSPTLVPQLENIIRYALKLQNVRTTGYDKKGIQEEISLTKMFEDHEHVLIDVFGEDIVFELRTLLIERSGYNFRNIHGHGLASDDDLESLISVFIWGITLHITCIGRMIQDRIDERLILESNQ